MTPEVHSYYGDVAQDQADTATARAQHQAALDAYAARQRGDTAAYAAAIQRLYGLGIQNAASASQQDLLAIANSAAGNSTLQNIEALAKIGAVLLAVYLGVQLVKALAPKGRR